MASCLPEPTTAVRRRTSDDACEPAAWRAHLSTEGAAALDVREGRGLPRMEEGPIGHPSGLCRRAAGALTVRVSGVGDCADHRAVKTSRALSRATSRWPHLTLLSPTARGPIERPAGFRPSLRTSSDGLTWNSVPSMLLTPPLQPPVVRSRSQPLHHPLLRGMGMAPRWPCRCFSSRRGQGPWDCASTSMCWCARITCKEILRMRVSAAVLTRTESKPPFASSRPLRIEELSLQGPGPGEVLVRVAAAGLCHSDLSVVDGVRPRPIPMVLGHEAAGVVEQVGTSVVNVRPGDHVVFAFVPSCGNCIPCLSGRPALCELGATSNTAGTLLSGSRVFRRADGTEVNHHLGVSAFADRTVVSAASLIPVPDDMPLEQAALFGCALLTGVGAVLNTAQVASGTTACVVGLGGVGLAAVMGARLAGCAQVVAVDVDPAKFDLASRVGATHVVQSGPSAIEQIREASSGGVDFAFEAAGSPEALATAYEGTRRGGTTVAIGLAHPAKRFALPMLGLVAEERRLLGSYMGSAVPRRDIPRYVELFRQGRLPVDALAGARYSLTDVNQAMDALAGGAVARQLLIIDG